MPTTTQHIEARNDPDLLARFIAAAEQASIADASTWVQANMGALVNATVDGDQRVSDVHAYAHQVRETYIAATPERPGADLAAVTDTHLITAITAVREP